MATNTEQVIANAEQVVAPAEVDPVTYEVIRHRLEAITEEGSATLIHVSGSPVVHATDYNVGMYTADGDTAVAGLYYMIPIPSTGLLIKEVLERFGDDIRPGDVFVCNDPFITTPHQSDVQFVAPFFHGDELTAWTGCLAHEMDIGGMEPGSWCPLATDVYQEGLLIPPSKIISEGTRVDALWDMITRNSRVPFAVSNDFTAFLAGIRVMHQRLKEVCDKYGGDVVAGTMKRNIEQSESEARSKLEKLPDGVFEHTSYLDHDGHANNLYRVHCRMTKKGSDLIFDYEADPQAAGMGNSTRVGTFGGIAAAMFAGLGNDIDWNEGLLRPVTLNVPGGTVISAEPPAPVSAGSVSANWVAADCAVGCMAKLFSLSDEYREQTFGPALGSWLLAQFGGLNQYGEPFATMYLDSLGWGGPAFANRDGIDTGGGFIVVAGGFNDVENQEMRQPLFYLWRREVADSGGAGEHRGGNGIEYALATYDTEVLQATLGSHGVSLPNCTGVFGGYPGSTSMYEFVRDSNWLELAKAGDPPTAASDLAGEYRVLEAKSPGLAMQPGDVVTLRVQNAGGYGDPLDRDPELVARDVLEHRVTTETARNIYGVALESDGSPDSSETQQLRADIKQKRLSKARIPEANATGTEPGATKTLNWGKYITLDLSEGGSGRLTCNCGHQVTFRDNWRDAVALYEPDQSEVGPHFRLDDRVSFRQFVCPGCGRSLWVDVLRKDESNPVDFKVS